MFKSSSFSYIVVMPVNQNSNRWGEFPYSPISLFYKVRFGEKTQKIPVTIASDCPNRQGLKGMQTCIFCDEWGSSAYPEQREFALAEQIRERLVRIKERHNVNSFIAYFQAYTSTFMGVKNLRQQFDIALSFPEVKGIVIGTRPDCLSTAVIDLWKEYQQKTFLSVELGVQTFDNEQLEFLKRGHTGEASIAAIQKIKKLTEVDLGIHLMFGLPGETNEQIIETARLISKLPVDNVKLHNLHVLKNTPLAELYDRHEFFPIELTPYTERVILFLQHLSPEVKIHRLAALSSRWDELVAPQWTKHKMKINQFIIGEMKKTGAWQGQYFTAEKEIQAPHPHALALSL